MVLMDKVLVWNVRGLNSPSKQKEIKNFMVAKKISLCCLVETKVKNEKLSVIQDSMFRGWCLASNFSKVKGGRILIDG